MSNEELPVSQEGEPEEKIIADAGALWTDAGEISAIPDAAHWPGAGRWEDLDKWKAIGATTAGHLKNLVILSERTEEFRVMVEWGPGGGANLVAIASIVPRFYGVDISAPTLEICGRVASQIEYGGFVPVHIDIAQPERAKDQIVEPVDLFLSTAVFQHLPGRNYAERVMRIAASLLSQGGLALIQTRYDDGSEMFRSRTGNYNENVFHFLSFRVEEFWTMAQSHGFEPLAVRLDPSVRYAFYYLQKK
ncbi:MAG: class I SAM-dependent methyltransferase [Myxococcota bacterium]|nr:class I SAM-dependent methyltransferase [Myxococcota bacterium]